MVLFVIFYLWIIALFVYLRRPSHAAASVVVVLRAFHATVLVFVSSVYWFSKKVGKESRRIKLNLRNREPAKTTRVVEKG